MQGMWGDMDGSSTCVLRVRGLRKTYPGTIALKGLDFDLDAGEVRALLGKNGAGKSTFVEILSGTIVPDAGEVQIDGRTVMLGSPTQAREEGISTVHQDLSLFPELTARENITIGRCSRYGVISRRMQQAEADAALEQMGSVVDLNARVGRLSARDQQLTAIAKALSYRPRVLILDEPTSALPSEEVGQLIALVRRLADRGVAVIYVSHRLDEIPRVASSVTVLRNGVLVNTLDIHQTTHSHIVEMMLGKALVQGEKPQSRSKGAAALSASRISNAKLRDITFQLHRGEILGLWGAPGAGRTELLRAIYGLDPIDAGTLSFGSSDVARPSPGDLIRLGVGFSPDDRKRDGLVLSLSVAENISLACLQEVSRGGVIQSQQLEQVAKKQVEQLSIKVSSLAAPVRSLSGGNQQKVVVGKLLAAHARVLLLDEPTKGIDVEAKSGLYSLLRALAEQGDSVIIAPTEIEELFLVCDRILVLRQGKVISETSIRDANLQNIMHLALTGENDERIVT
jgi:ABC-type sugar transport system ATPase subunit